MVVVLFEEVFHFAFSAAAGLASFSSSFFLVRDVPVSWGVLLALGERGGSCGDVRKRVAIRDRRRGGEELPRLVKGALRNNLGNGKFTLTELERQGEVWFSVRVKLGVEKRVRKNIEG